MIALALIAILSAWRWGDWKNWNKYYSTILYMIVCNLLYNFFTYNHPLWSYLPTLIPNHTFSDLIITFIVFPATILVYIPYFPKGRFFQILYITGWVALYSIVEWFGCFVGAFKHSHGWGLGWSIQFNYTMFVMLMFHYKKPLWTWFVSVFIILFYLITFGIPIEKMK